VATKFGFKLGLNLRSNSKTKDKKKLNLGFKPKLIWTIRF